MTLATEIESPAPFQRDHWLSQTLGFPSYALRQAFLADATASDPEDLLDAMDDCREKCPRAFLFAKASTGDVAQLRLLQDCSFRVVDVSVTLTRSTETQQTSTLRMSETPLVCIRPASSTDATQVENIAGSCFRYSRFHLDPHIPNAVANDVKRRWAANYFTGQRGDRIWVAEVAGKVVGFLGALRQQSADGACAVIDLVGIEACCQGRGIGAALVKAFITHYQSDSLELRVGTQAANAPSLRLYQKAGFVLTQSSYVLHFHYLE